MKHLILTNVPPFISNESYIKMVKTVNILEFSRTRESLIMFESPHNPAPSLTPAL